MFVAMQNRGFPHCRVSIASIESRSMEGIATFGRARGDTLVDQIPVVIRPEEPADTTI